MAYFISLHDDVDLKIEPKFLENNLKARWALVEFDNFNFVNNPYILSWAIDFNGSRLLGGLHKDRQGVSLDNDPESVAIFAIWYRSLIPAQYQLFIFHDSSDREIEINSNISADELLDLLNEL